MVAGLTRVDVFDLKRGIEDLHHPRVKPLARCEERSRGPPAFVGQQIIDLPHWLPPTVLAGGESVSDPPPRAYRYTAPTHCEEGQKGDQRR
jgi:hypothetical protein